ncbi:MAG: hypothetical protein M1814_004880 [Vezdaea aestivalis]|nr:MAG: hypothetical protein M1814_004880 [Vezdaea aestivalis]
MGSRRLIEELVEASKTSCHSTRRRSESMVNWSDNPASRLGHQPSRSFSILSHGSFVTEEELADIDDRNNQSPHAHNLWSTREAFDKFSDVQAGPYSQDHVFSEAKWSKQTSLEFSSCSTSNTFIPRLEYETLETVIKLVRWSQSGNITAGFGGDDLKSAVDGKGSDDFGDDEFIDLHQQATAPQWKGPSIESPSVATQSPSRVLNQPEIFVFNMGTPDEDRTNHGPLPGPHLEGDELVVSGLNYLFNRQTKWAAEAVQDGFPNIFMKWDHLNTFKVTTGYDIFLPGIPFKQRARGENYIRALGQIEMLEAAMRLHALPEYIYDRIVETRNWLYATVAASKGRSGVGSLTGPPLKDVQQRAILHAYILSSKEDRQARSRFAMAYLFRFIMHNSERLRYIRSLSWALNNGIQEGIRSYPVQETPTRPGGFQSTGNHLARLQHSAQLNKSRQPRKGKRKSCPPRLCPDSADPRIIFEGRRKKREKSLALSGSGAADDISSQRPLIETVQTKNQTYQSNSAPYSAGGGRWWFENSRVPLKPIGLDRCRRQRLTKRLSDGYLVTCKSRLVRNPECCRPRSDYKQRLGLRGGKTETNLEQAPLNLGLRGGADPQRQSNPAPQEGEGEWLLMDQSAPATSRNLRRRGGKNPAAERATASPYDVGEDKTLITDEGENKSLFGSHWPKRGGLPEEWLSGESKQTTTETGARKENSRGRITSRPATIGFAPVLQTQKRAIERSLSPEKKPSRSLNKSTLGGNEGSARGATKQTVQKGSPFTSANPYQALTTETDIVLGKAKKPRKRRAKAKTQVERELAENRGEDHQKPQQQDGEGSKLRSLTLSLDQPASTQPRPETHESSSPETQTFHTAPASPVTPATHTPQGQHPEQISSSDEYYSAQSSPFKSLRRTTSLAFRSFPSSKSSERNEASTSPSKTSPSKAFQQDFSLTIPSTPKRLNLNLHYKSLLESQTSPHSRDIPSPSAVSRASTHYTPVHKMESSKQSSSSKNPASPSIQVHGPSGEFEQIIPEIPGKISSGTSPKAKVNISTSQSRESPLSSASLQSHPSNDDTNQPEDKVFDFEGADTAERALLKKKKKNAKSKAQAKRKLTAKANAILEASDEGITQLESQVSESGNVTPRPALAQFGGFNPLATSFQPGPSAGEEGLTILDQVPTASTSSKSSTCKNKGKGRASEADLAKEEKIRAIQDAIAKLEAQQTPPDSKLQPITEYDNNTFRNEAEYTAALTGMEMGSQSAIEKAKFETMKYAREIGNPNFSFDPEFANIDPAAVQEQQLRVQELLQGRIHETAAYKDSSSFEFLESVRKQIGEINDSLAAGNPVFTYSNDMKTSDVIEAARELGWGQEHFHADGMFPGSKPSDRSIPGAQLVQSSDGLPVMLGPNYVGPWVSKAGDSPRIRVGGDELHPVPCSFTDLGPALALPQSTVQIAQARQFSTDKKLDAGKEMLRQMFKANVQAAKARADEQAAAQKADDEFWTDFRQRDFQAEMNERWAPLWFRDDQQRRHRRNALSETTTMPSTWAEHQAMKPFFYPQVDPANDLWQSGSWDPLVKGDAKEVPRLTNPWPVPAIMSREWTGSKYHEYIAKAERHAEEKEKMGVSTNVLDRFERLRLAHGLRHNGNITRSKLGRSTPFDKTVFGSFVEQGWPEGFEWKERVEGTARGPLKDWAAMLKCERDEGKMGTKLPFEEQMGLVRACINAISRGQTAEADKVFLRHRDPHGTLQRHSADLTQYHQAGDLEELRGDWKEFRGLHRHIAPAARGRRFRR